MISIDHCLLDTSEEVTEYRRFSIYTNQQVRESMIDRYRSTTLLFGDVAYNIRSAVLCTVHITHSMKPHAPTHPCQ